VKRTFAFIAVASLLFLSGRMAYGQSTMDQFVSALLAPEVDVDPAEDLNTNQQLLLAGNSLEPTLIAAFNSGPSSEASSAAYAQALNLMTKLQNWVTTNGPSLGYDSATIAAITSKSPTQFATESQNAYNLSFQTNALVALGPIAGPTGRALLAQLAQTAGSPFQGAAQQILGNSFQSFSAGFEAEGGTHASFEMSAIVALPTGTPINPPTNSTVVRIGRFETTIPAQSCKAHKNGSFTYEGSATSADGQTTFAVEIVIKPLTPASGQSGTLYHIDVEGSGIDLSGLAKPVEVSLSLGSVSGTTVAKSS
jgi:hypothetical protein